MAFNFSPKVVTDGLVLALDAANPRSYVSGSTVWSDLTSYNVSGSLLNGTSYSSNGIGSLVFDGVDDVVNVQGLNSYKPQFPLSVCVAFKTNASGVPQNLCKTDNPTTSFHAGIMLSVSTTNQINIEYGNNSGNAPAGRRSYQTAVNTVSTGNWYVLSAILPTNLTCQCFLNGVQISAPYLSGTATTLVYPGSASSIGYKYMGTNIPGWYLNGNISTIHIYNRALTATEVLQNYNAIKSRFNLT